MGNGELSISDTLEQGKKQELAARVFLAILGKTPITSCLLPLPLR